MKRITLLAHLDNHTGYGQQAVKIIRGLEEYGWFVSVRPIRMNQREDSPLHPEILGRVVSCVQPEPLELLLAPPNHVPTPGKLTVYYTMWESTRLPKDSVQLLNMAHAVVVPCQWNKDNFQYSGVTAPIHLCPLGVDPSVYHPGTGFYPQGFGDPIRPFVFGTGGRLRHGSARKGVNDVIANFLEAFPIESYKDVRLSVKVFPDDPVFRVDDKRVTYVTGCLDESAMVRWFHGIHCFVSAAKGEGWGLMQQQAMACARLLIAARHGGVAEFFNKDAGVELPYVVGSAVENWEGHGDWAWPSHEGMRSAMREVAVMSRDSILAKAYSAREMAAKFSWQNSIKTLADILDLMPAL